MQKKSSELRSKNINSEDNGEFDIRISISDFRLLTFQNNSQIIGLYLSEDNKNIFINNPRIIASQLMPYDTDSIDLEAFSKGNIQTVSLPNTNLITRYIQALSHEFTNKLTQKELARQEPFPTTQWSYLTEGPLVTKH